MSSQTQSFSHNGEAFPHGEQAPYQADSAVAGSKEGKIPSAKVIVASMVQ